MINYKNAFLLLLLLCTHYIFGQTKTSINVTSYGANGKDQLDDTKAFQKSIDELANKNGGTLLVPKGVYYISHLTFFGQKYSNISIIGDNAIIFQIVPKQRKAIREGLFRTFAQRYAADGCFVFDAQVSNQKDDRYSIKNIYMSGLSFKSNVKKNGFDELLHQVSAHGVSNFTIENCNFIGFYGDGVAINAGTDFNTNSYAYNKEVKIKNCTFDGVNKNNRQGISIYYCDNFIIENCNFKNITRSDMPGAIDIEPDRDFLVSRNGSIKNCNFDNIGGIAAITIILQPSTDLNAFSNKNYIVENCNFKNVNSSLAIIGNDTFKSFSNKENIVVFRNSKVMTSFSAVDFRKAYGVLVDHVDFTNIYNTGNNVVTEGGATNITFQNCTFDSIKNKNGLGFHGETKSINFINNIFKNFTATGITINNINGVGEFGNNKFLSTQYKDSLPLITQYYSSKKQISKMKFYNNINEQNFNPLDINFFYKPN